MASPRGQLQQLSPCRRLSACKISSSPKKRHRGELSPTPAKLAGMQSAAGVAEEEAAPLKSTRRIAINGLPPRSPLPTATPLKADGNDSAFVSPPFTDLSSMATPGSLNSSSSSVDATAFSFPDLSPSPHPMSNAMLSDRASFDEMQAGSEAQHPDSARRHSEPSLGRIMPMPDAQAFESPSLVDKNEARRNSRGQAPPCPDTPLRKTPNGKTRDLIESQVLFAGPDFDPDAKDTAAAPHAEQFEFMGLLGAGAFGEVFKARCLISGDSYAIKKTKKQFRSEHDRDHALEEVRTVMAIGEHQNIVQCLGAWQADGHLFVQMEYCSLGNLKNYASHLKELMAEELWCILHDCSEGLRHIHDKDFLHLDLKPENIFLTETGLLKIGDFGVTVHQGCFEDGNEGDSVYLAPEVLDGDIGPAADIFSLGIMLFELAGQVELPANGGLWLSLRQRCRDYVKIPAEPELEAMIHLMMDPNPAARPTATWLLAHPKVSEIATNDSVRPRFGRKLALSFDQPSAVAATSASGRASPLAFEFGRTRSFAAEVSLEAMDAGDAAMSSPSAVDPFTPKVSIDPTGFQAGFS